MIEALYGPEPDRNTLSRHITAETRNTTVCLLLTAVLVGFSMAVIHVIDTIDDQPLTYAQPELVLITMISLGLSPMSLLSAALHIGQRNQLKQQLDSLAQKYIPRHSMC